MADETVGPGAAEGRAMTSPSLQDLRRPDYARGLRSNRSRAQRIRESMAEAIREQRLSLDDGVPASATVPLPSLWFAFADWLGIAPKEAADLIERLLKSSSARVFGEDDFGRFSPVVDEEHSRELLVEAWNRASDLDWDPTPCAEWNFIRIAARDVDNMKREAARLYERAHPHQSAASSADYLDPRHPRYASKLAAAVHAWLAVVDPAGKSPKQALSNWLRDHAAEFALTDDDGKPNESGIEECAKVANWQPGGGAPKTPGA